MISISIRSPVRKPSISMACSAHLVTLLQLPQCRPHSVCQQCWLHACNGSFGLLLKDGHTGDGEQQQTAGTRHPHRAYTSCSPNAAETARIICTERAPPYLLILLLAISHNVNRDGTTTAIQRASASASARLNGWETQTAAPLRLIPRTGGKEDEVKVEEDEVGSKKRRGEAHRPLTT